MQLYYFNWIVEQKHLNYSWYRNYRVNKYLNSMISHENVNLIA